jgi:hypothetical protein
MSVSSSSLAPGDQVHDRDFVVRDLDDERDLPGQRLPRNSNRFARNRTTIVAARPSIGKRIFRTLGRFVVAVLIGVGLTLAWQSYGEQAKAIARTWAPSLAWALPQSDAKAPSADSDILPELARQLKLITLDVAIVRRDVGQLAANQDQIAANQDQIAAKQDQLTQNIAALQEIEQDARQRAYSSAAPKPVSPPAPKALRPAVRIAPQAAPQ